MCDLTYLIVVYNFMLVINRDVCRIAHEGEKVQSWVWNGISRQREAGAALPPSP